VGKLIKFPKFFFIEQVELSKTKGFTTYKEWVISFPGGGYINVSGTTGHEVADAYDAVGNHLAHYT
jgi:hypothetical protein